jgi:hypothetical protein
MEALLALALTLMLAGMVSSFLYTLSRSKKLAQDAAVELRSVGTFFDRLEDDLAACIAGGDGLGAGVVGAGDRLAVLSRGVGIPTDPALGEKAAREQLSDLRGTEFAFDGSASVLGRRWIGAGGPSGQALAVASGVAAVRFRYYDGKSWSDTFDSSKSGGLPVAIEVGVWVASGGPAVAAEDTLGVGAPMRAPDRWRVITVPDGPVSGWKEGPP